MGDSGFFGTLKQWIHDAFVWVFKGILDAIAALISSIPVPDFLSTYSLQSLLSMVDPSVLYFLSKSGFAQGLAILGAGFAFRMLRKVFTLGQW